MNIDDKIKNADRLDHEFRHAPAIPGQGQKKKAEQLIAVERGVVEALAHDAGVLWRMIKSEFGGENL